jgi:microcystin-dependent protein
MAMVRTMAGPISAFGASACAGQQLAINRNQAMFSLLGTSYGGNGQTSFALPNLGQHATIGGGPNQPRTPNAQPMTYMIAVDAPPGSAAFPMLGAIGLFAGLRPPSGWALADGSLLPLSRNVPLFQTIGNTYGGNNVSTFALPDLGARTALGAGQGPVAAVSLGQKVDPGPDTPVGCLGLNYIINVSGTAPPNQGKGGFPDTASVLGEVIAFAGTNIPPGWLPADGRELPIAGNEALFGLIGDSFGGDGKTAFGLPDLRARMVIGS